MSLALRVGVPLNNRCSRKCEAPAMAGRSSREPALTQMPIVTERTDGIRSVTMRNPDSNSVRPSSTSVALGRERGVRAGSARFEARVRPRWRADPPIGSGTELLSVAPVAAGPPVAVATGTAVATVALTTLAARGFLGLRALGREPLVADRLQRDPPALLVDL